jgi:serine/threonine protein kinase
LLTRFSLLRPAQPENVMFDESYNVKVTDFGACVCVPVSDVLEQPRAMTGELLWGFYCAFLAVRRSAERAPRPAQASITTPTISACGAYARCSRSVHRSASLSFASYCRRVGTEAYAPPEIFYPGKDGYDATKYDVWSLGIILFLMLCIDSLDIIQIPEMSTGARRTTLRMPFLSYANVIYPLRGNATGACGNLTNQLDDPPPSASHPAPALALSAMLTPSGATQASRGCWRRRRPRTSASGATFRYAFALHACLLPAAPPLC